jgi:uncharacterized protein CbrC (UPF0167 family)
MNEEDPPRQLSERTGRHLCILCLADISAQEYFEGDFVCRKCAEKMETYPLASTPGPREDR